jgi:hypothetical protein
VKPTLTAAVLKCSGVDWKPHFHYKRKDYQKHKKMHEVHLLVFRQEHEVKETGSISTFVCQGTGAKNTLLFAKERATLQSIEC